MYLERLAEEAATREMTSRSHASAVARGQAAESMSSHILEKATRPQGRFAKPWIAFRNEGDSQAAEWVRQRYQYRERTRHRLVFRERGQAVPSQMARMRGNTSRLVHTMSYLMGLSAPFRKIARRQPESGGNQ